MSPNVPEPIPAQSLRVTKVVFAAIGAALVAVTATPTARGFTPSKSTPKSAPHLCGHPSLAPTITAQRPTQCTGNKRTRRHGAPRASLSGDTLEYTDAEVSGGGAYEYQWSRTPPLATKVTAISLLASNPAGGGRGTLVLVSETGPPRATALSLSTSRGSSRRCWRVREVSVSRPPRHRGARRIKSIYQRNRRA